ncbi:hypothetical protein EDD36DRAFT_414511 [Exophiala viscosa]|uniref:Uncharacterized protein n=1 Tax=Exophiala viscosa TaxID=2486360 RepID=A0AAN6E6P9_9EURO|nr:hypothetical protein EDD36DRAFT_414511 [Exophiala viscosa]
MWKQILPYVLLKVAPATSSYAYARDLVEVIYGPQGVCSISGTVLVEKQPVYYSEYINGNTVIDPFHDGHPITITDAPTVIVVLSYITTTVTPPTNGAGPILTSTPTSSMNQITSSPGMSSMTSSLSTGSASSTGLASSVNSPSVPTSTQTSASGPSSTPVTSSTPTIAALAIGQDFPAGIVTSLPSGSNLILALANLNAQRMRVLRRQDSDSAAATAAVSAPPIAVVDLSPTNTLDASASAVPTGQNSVSEDNCDSASPLGLVNGSLLTSGSAAIAKPLGASSAALAPLAFNASVDQVNTGFSFDDGILQWNTDDVGEASFYSCDGVIWAGFPDPPTDAGTCEPVVVGAIGAQACAARIEADGGTVNPDLTAPVADDGDSSSTTSTVYTTTSVTITSALYTTLSTTSSLVQIFSISDSIVTVPPTPEPATTPVTTTSSLDTSLSTSASPSTSQTPSSGMITTSFTSISVTSSGYTGSNTTTMTSTSPMQASITTMTTTSTAPLYGDDFLSHIHDAFGEPDTPNMAGQLWK